jgi:hypothetical protein
MMKPFCFRVISQSLFEKNDDIITCTIGGFCGKIGSKIG